MGLLLCSAAKEKAHLSGMSREERRARTAAKKADSSTKATADDSSSAAKEKANLSGMSREERRARTAAKKAAEAAAASRK